MAISDFERKWTVASLASAALLAVTTMAFQAGAGALADSASEQLAKCAAEHDYLSPAPRAAVCLCFVEKTHRWVALAWGAVSPAAIDRRATRVAFNSCVASEFAQKSS